MEVSVSLVRGFLEGLHLLEDRCKHLAVLTTDQSDCKKVPVTNQSCCIPQMSSESDVVNPVVSFGTSRLTGL